jgi:hypothetical protein
MAIRKFRTGQMSYNALTYVGTAGTIFYDEDTGALRLSDGVTPGGSLISYPLASSSQIGGIKLGPGIELNSQGQIIIDSAGLNFNFGDFEAITGFYSDSTAYALLSSTNADEDIVVASNGDGSVKLVGAFEVYRTNGSVTGSLEDEEPFFKIKEDGQVRILVPVEDPVEGGIEIVGSATGTYIAPGQIGAMMQLTGNPNVSCRIYQDSLGSYSSYVGRRYNGTVLAPTQVLAGEDVFRINATASTNAGLGNVALAQISFNSLENQTTTAQGSSITLTVTPVGQPATNRVNVATITVANGVSATKFTGPLTGNVTGDVSGNAGTVTNGVYTTGDQTIGGAKTFSTQVTAPRVVDTSIRTINGGTTCTIDFATDSIILWTAPSGTANITLSNYTAGARVKLIIALTTSRDINYGVIDNAHSSTGSDDWNGSGAGSVDISNTAMHLTYTCVTDVASGCYVQVVAN